MSYGRLVVSKDLKYVDLADLFNHPWWRIQLAGYGCFWISRIDGQQLTQDEILLLEERVEADLRFDYDEESLIVMFDSDTSPSALYVTVIEP